MPRREPATPFVSRAGLKLAHALDEFGVDVAGLTCADFGCNVGGFTDCLLQRGAKLVFALDTGYGTLAWKLRNDPRVIVMERTNALHVLPPSPPGRGAGGEGLPNPDAAPEKRGREPFPEKDSRPLFCDLVVIDLGWTPQRLAVPAALRWLRSARSGEGPLPGVITLIKPHYELTDDEKRTLLRAGALDTADAGLIAQRVLDAMPALGAEVVAHTRSPLFGRKSSRARTPESGPGNVEFLALLRPPALSTARH